jgi:lipoprotein-anchoring transpeptidase ErfK/SrfK
LQLGGKTVCTQTGTTSELNLSDYFRANDMPVKVLALGTAEESLKAYDDRKCDVLTSDVSQLYAERLKLAAPGAVLAVIVVSALLYGYIATKGPGIIGAGVTSSSRAPRVQEDVVMADLKPGVDGGSTGEGLPFALQRQVVFYRTTVVPGSIVVDRENRFLYLIGGNNSARRYGIGIAQECLKGGSFFRVTSKLEWPDWRPSGANTRDADALLGAAGRPGSLLGARALLLDKPGLLIHGTNSPKTIGHLVASGCIRLVNDDVEDLYRRVSLETRVVFVS